MGIIAYVLNERIGNERDLSLMVATAATVYADSERKARR